jgi:hypothetical protein
MDPQGHRFGFALFFKNQTSYTIQNLDAKGKKTTEEELWS